MNLQASLGPHRYSDGMTQRLTPGTVALLVTAPLLWAGNAVVGRLVHDLVPPITLNFLRWALALALLLPLTHRVLRPDSPLWPHWRRYALLGLLGVGLYNALQYLALQTSTPINVTLVGSSMPVWMLAVGALFFGVAVTRRQLAGAALSMIGVLTVLSRGEWSQLLALRLVAGDLFMLLATISWSFYSWLLGRTSGRATPMLRVGALELDPARLAVVWRGRPLDLPRREFALLRLLMEQRGRPISRESAQQRLYGWDEDVASNALDVHIHALRKKLDPALIRTLRGIGFALDEKVAQAGDGDRGA